jgi:hypothetical protein
MSDNFSDGWVDHIHDLEAVRLNELPVNVVLRDCFHASLSLGQEPEPEPEEESESVSPAPCEQSS